MELSRELKKTSDTIIPNWVEKVQNRRECKEVSAVVAKLLKSFDANESE